MSQKTSVILHSSHDWDEWFEILKSIALSADIWQYVNLDVPRHNLSVPREPLEPRPRDVVDANEVQIVRYSTHSADEKEEYTRLLRMYKRELDIYDR